MAWKRPLLWIVRDFPFVFYAIDEAIDGNNCTADMGAGNHLCNTICNYVENSNRYTEQHNQSHNDNVYTIRRCGWLSQNVCRVSEILIYKMIIAI